MRGGIQLLRLIERRVKQPAYEAASRPPSPDGELFVDGALVGTTPATLRLPPGKHTVKVSSGSVRDSANEVTIISALGLRLEATLDSIRLGLQERTAQTRKWPHKRLSHRHVGPFGAELCFGMSDLGEEVLVRDFNEHGLYFWSRRRMPVGANIEIRMEPPLHIAPSGGRTVCYRATVLRVEETPDGKFGTAALIKSCTPKLTEGDSRR
jgi:hypothetical protein